jgi:hypothetical protein
VYSPVTKDGDTKNVLLVEALRDAVMTVNHEPFFEPSVHGGGSSPVLEPAWNELPTHAAAPLYMAVPPWGLELFCAEVTLAKSKQRSIAAKVLVIFMSSS